MPICSFCKKRYEIPRGITLILNDGRSLHFCGSKCKNNNRLGRDSKKVNWVRRDKKGEVESVEEKSSAVIEEKVEAKGPEKKEKSKKEEKKE